jgi:hypothetical protein
VPFWPPVREGWAFCEPKPRKHKNQTTTCRGTLWFIDALPDVVHIVLGVCLCPQPPPTRHIIVRGGTTKPVAGGRPQPLVARKA